MSDTENLAYSQLNPPPQCAVIALRELADKILRVHDEPNGVANAREVERLDAFLRTTRQVTLDPFLEFGRAGTSDAQLKLMQTLFRDIDSAKSQLDLLGSRGWGPHCCREALRSIRYAVESTVLSLKIMVILEILEPARSGTVDWSPPDHVRSTIRRLNDSATPKELRDGGYRAAHSTANLDSMTLADEVVERGRRARQGLWRRSSGILGGQVPLVRSVIQTLTSHLKPVLFGAKVAGECLKTYTDLKVDLSTRYRAMCSKRPLAFKLVYFAAWMLSLMKGGGTTRSQTVICLKELEAIQKSLTYENAEVSLRKFRELKNDFALVADSALLTTLALLVVNRSEMEVTVAPGPTPTKSRVRRMLKNGIRIVSGQYRKKAGRGDELHGL
ncbi:hypothetical protein DFH07DRAFT_774404 [Mycena maculata]|uniref:Uncharacterized protein n=1 Tax=Mycena maculata TaxID=230809 RepID=A0AAD7NB84_9AGAR|nr:hypothetical protein DFH07DRAFT_774404 [Mycena maculata]